MTTDDYWFKVHHADEIADIKLLGLKAIGSYFGLMLHYFREGGLPDDDNVLRKIAGAEPREWQSIRAELRKRTFDHNWRHKRWDRQIDVREKRAKAGKASAASRGMAPPQPSYDADAEVPF